MKRFELRLLVKILLTCLVASVKAVLTFFSIKTLLLLRKCSPFFPYVEVFFNQRIALGSSSRLEDILVGSSRVKALAERE